MTRVLASIVALALPALASAITPIAHNTPLDNLGSVTVTLLHLVP